MKSLVLIAFFLSNIAVADFDSVDPLFSRMVGHWTGTGVRHYTFSDRESQISADVQSSIQMIDGKGRLISKNQITETFDASGSEGSSKTYQATYWIQLKMGVTGSYELGSLASAQISEGSFSADKLVFETSQSFGDYVIHSQTQFAAFGSTYTETMTEGSKILSNTVIRYTPSSN